MEKPTPNLISQIEEEKDQQNLSKITNYATQIIKILENNKKSNLNKKGNFEILFTDKLKIDKCLEEIFLVISQIKNNKNSVSYKVISIDEIQKQFSKFRK